MLRTLLSELSFLLLYFLLLRVCFAWDFYAAPTCCAFCDTGDPFAVDGAGALPRFPSPGSAHSPSFPPRPARGVAACGLPRKAWEVLSLPSAMTA